MSSTRDPLEATRLAFDVYLKHTLELGDPIEGRGSNEVSSFALSEFTTVRDELARSV